MVKLPPYDTQARYFKVFIESDGTDITITLSDLAGLTKDSSQWIRCPLDFQLLDIIEDIHCVAAETSVNRVIDVRINTDGSESFFIPAPANFDYATFYIMGYTND